MALRVALSAGHYLGTVGKSCHKSLDPAETKEWVLNNRIVTRVETILAGYNGVETLRLDDPTGRKYVSNETRARKANSWKAQLYVAVHHNAAWLQDPDDTFDGGGIVVYIHDKNAKPGAEAWQEVIYDYAVKRTGLVGNRATPLAKASLYECGAPNCAAVLIECGFMNSTVDVPIILSEAFADNMAKALAEAIIAESGATSKTAATTVKTYGITDISFYILGPNSRGDQVKAVQMMLNARGYKDASGKVLIVDGSYGPATKYAVEAFQRAKGLTVDGYAGHMTLRALFAAI